MQMSLFFRRISIFGRFPFVRLIQVIDNPIFILQMLKKNLIYKRSTIDYKHMYAQFRFLSGQETLEELMRSGRSLARFSDGEFELITGAGIYPPDSDWCQKWSPALRDDILSALSCCDPRLLVAVDPPSTFLASRDSIHTIRFEWNMWVDMRRLMWKYLAPGGGVGHSHLFLKANCPDLNWGKMKNFLADKNIVIATGNVEKLMHLNLGARTFFIECGTENAYERSDEIKRKICEMISNACLSKDKTIVFASLGPTAGIIAHQLLDSNICVWDTGHMFEFADKNFIENVLNNKMK
jgi:hypothetical protein